MDKYKKKESWKSIVSIILVVLLAFGVFASVSVLFQKDSGKPNQYARRECFRSQWWNKILR